MDTESDAQAVFEEFGGLELLRASDSQLSELACSLADCRRELTKVAASTLQQHNDLVTCREKLAAAQRDVERLQELEAKVRGMFRHGSALNGTHAGFVKQCLADIDAARAQQDRDDGGS